MPRRCLSVWLTVLALWALTALPARADGGHAYIEPGVSTLGVGGDIGYRTGEYFGLHANVNGISLGIGRFSANGMDFGGHVDLFTLGLLADFYPLGALGDPILANIAITGGLYYNANTGYGDASVDPDITYDIGGQSFRGSDIGPVTAKIRYNPISPYLGLGWQGGLSQDGGLRLHVGAGALFQGGSSVSIDGFDHNTPGLDAAMRELSAKVRDKADQYQVVPVVAVGVGYCF